jgi:hypothetical protein
LLVDDACWKTMLGYRFDALELAPVQASWRQKLQGLAILESCAVAQAPYCHVRFEKSFSTLLVLQICAVVLWNAKSNCAIQLRQLNAPTNNIAKALAALISTTPGISHSKIAAFTALAGLLWQSSNSNL